MKRRWLMLPLLIVAAVYWSGTAAAQAESCPKPIVLPGQRVEVIGSLDAGGLPYRSRPRLAEAPVGFIPIGTTITLAGDYSCAEGRNWYTVEATTAVDASYDHMAVTDGDGFSYWIRGVTFCSVPSVENGRTFFPPDTLGSILSTEYLPAELVFRFAVSPAEPAKHPVLLDYYTLNIQTGELASIENPYANILMPEVAAKLGITDIVYGAESLYQPISVSPDGSQFLYFVPQPPIQDCAHACLRSQAFIANADGTDPIVLGEVLAYNLQSIDWAANGRIYLTFLPEDGFSGGAYTVEFCKDGACAANVLAEAGLSLTPDMLAMPSVSPDGGKIAFERLSSGEHAAGSVVVNLESNTTIDLPDNGAVNLPVIWLDNDSILYPVDVDTLVDRAAIPETLLQHDGALYIKFDFSTNTYAIYSPFVTGDSTMFDDFKARWFYTGSSVFVMEYEKLTLYCADRG
ncbi:MAG: hypothetical protein R3E39_16220 [Anaerolineae bacterium]